MATVSRAKARSELALDLAAADVADMRLVRYIATRPCPTHSEALVLLRQTFPDMPLSRRVAACSHLRSPSARN